MGISGKRIQKNNNVNKITLSAPNVGAFLLAAAILLACGKQADNKPPRASDVLLQQFPLLEKMPDTLHFFTIQDDSTMLDIPDSVLVAALPDSIFDELHFETSEADFHPRFRFPLDALHDACVVYVDEFWFHRQSLLVFDKNKKRFVGAQELSQFFGGDGGQVSSESWMLPKQQGGLLYTKESWHTITLDEGDEPLERIEENAHLEKWSGTGFVPVPLQDSLAMQLAFPMKWEW